MANPKFDALLERMHDIHNAKNSDYASDDNPYSNFEEAAATAGCSVETVFRVLIGVKLARLKQLALGKVPNFESIADSQLDLAVYAALYASYDAPVTKNDVVEVQIGRRWCQSCQVTQQAHWHPDTTEIACSVCGGLTRAGNGDER